MHKIQKPEYVEWKASIEDAEEREILFAVLGEAGFSMFEESESEIKAYIERAAWDADLTVDLIKMYLPESQLQFQTTVIESQNWNSEWEKNYPDIHLDDFCQVLPSFRTPQSGFAHTIVIDPKMSFGTGHHETTQLVMNQMKNLDFQHKTVLDMGCGTGILGILAAMLGAKTVMGIDIDAWCIENSAENIAQNHIQNMELLMGGAETIPANQQYDIILANINRNILLQDGAAYVQHLASPGTLIISGFYEIDIPALTSFFEGLGLKYMHTLTSNRDWTSLRFDF